MRVKGEKAKINALRWICRGASTTRVCMCVYWCVCVFGMCPSLRGEALSGKAVKIF